MGEVSPDGNFQYKAKSALSQIGEGALCFYCGSAAGFDGRRGGAAYPEGGWEFNLTNDVNAARKVFSSDIELWQVPMDCYTQMQIGYAELQRKVRPCGELGRYLFDEMQEVGMKEDWPTGESWALGDSPAIGLALNPGCGSYTVMDAPMLDDKGFYTGHYDHKIRVYNRIDSRYILEDFFAKLAIWAENNER